MLTLYSLRNLDLLFILIQFPTQRAKSNSQLLLTILHLTLPMSKRKKLVLMLLYLAFLNLMLIQMLSFTSKPLQIMVAILT